MTIFLRRNGKVLGAFDREDYLSLRDQGGVFSGDEWSHVGGDVWFLVGSKEPFLRRSEEKRQKAVLMEHMIADAMNDTYNFKVWYSRVSYRAGIHAAPVNPDAPGLVGRSFLSSVELAEFGAFSESVTADFSRVNSSVRRLSPLCSEWMCPSGLGKTSFGRAIEMVRNVSLGLGLRKEDHSYMHPNRPCSVTLSFQFRDGLDSARLILEKGHAELSASPRVREALSRVRFVECLEPRPGQDYLEPRMFEVVRSGWLGLCPGFPVSGEGVLDEEALRRCFVAPSFSKRVLAEILALLHEVEANELTLIIEKPLACLDIKEARDALKYISSASLRGANQVLLLDDAK